MKKPLIWGLCIVAFIAYYSYGKALVKEEAQHISLVQNSPTFTDEFSVVQLLTEVAKVSYAAGNKVEPKGWMADGKKVIFILTENGRDLHYEWIVENGKVKPANKLAADLSREG